MFLATIEPISLWTASHSVKEPRWTKGSNGRPSVVPQGMLRMDWIQSGFDLAGKACEDPADVPPDARGQSGLLPKGAKRHDLLWRLNASVSRIARFNAGCGPFAGPTTQCHPGWLDGATAGAVPADVRFPDPRPANHRDGRGSHGVQGLAHPRGPKRETRFLNMPAGLRSDRTSHCGGQYEIAAHPLAQAQDGYFT